MAKYVMALDAGTTSNRCILFNEKGEMCSVAQKEFTQYFPQPGWVEHDANEIWQTQLSVAREAMQKVGAKAEDIAAIGITNQRETTIVWDRATGQPVYHAIVWQCRRTADMKDELISKYPDIADEAYHKTGLVFDPYFSGTKLRWILNNVEGVRARAEAGELCFGTVDTWLIYKLTKGKIFATDYSNASRTLMFNINTLTWDDSNYALLWAIVKDGKVVDFTLVPSYTVDDTSATYAVRAANEMGGLSEPAQVGSEEGIEIVETPYSDADGDIYTIQGIKGSKPQHGIYIINGKKEVIK